MNDSYLAKPLLNTGVDLRRLAPMVDRKLAEDMTQPPADELAKDMLALFREAVSYKEPYRKEMEQAYWAARNEYDPVAKCKIIDPSERAFYAGLFSRQLSTYMAWVLDRISQTDSFFTLTPTPIPAVAQRFQEKAVARVLRELKVLNYLPTDIALQYAKERIVDLKASINNILYQDATRALKGMETAMNDALIEGGFRKAYIEFHHDLFSSLGVMKFPAVEFEERVKWDGDKITTVTEAILKFRRVSPFDFYWSPDSTNAQDGRYVIERMRMPYSALYWMNDKATGTIKDTVEYVLSKYNSGTAWLDGIAGNRNETQLAGDTGQQVGTAYIPGTLDVLSIHTQLLGQRAIEYGVKTYTVAGSTKKIDPEKEYNVEVWVTQGLTVRLTVNGHPTGRRPYQTASYEPIPGQLYGVSGWKKLAAWEMAFRSGHRNLLRAVAFEAGVIAEVDTGRFASNQTPKSIEPWKVYNVDADFTGGGQPAVRFLRPPTTSVSLREYLANVESQAQKATGIYDTMAGSTAYGTVARTSFGIQSVQANATKIIFAKAEYVDKYATEPLLEALYVYLMMYGEDESIKADAQVNLRGLTSIATREAEQQKAIQLLQYLPAMMQVGQASGVQAVPPSVIQTLFRVIVSSLGGNIDDLPDPQSINSVAQAIGLDPAGDFAKRQDVLQQNLPSQAIQTPAQPQTPVLG